MDSQFESDGWESIGDGLYRKKVWKGWVIAFKENASTPASLTYMEDRKYEWNP